MKLKMTKRILGLGLLLGGLAMTGCGDASKSDADAGGEGIVNGKSVSAKAGDMVVALKIQNDEGEGLCSGSVLDDQTILTAAHCVEMNPTQLVAVFDPRADSALADRRRTITNFVQNPKWKSSNQELGDVALLHFEGGLPDGAKPVKLATKSDNPEVGTDVLLLGYGVTNGMSREGAGVLRKTETRVIQAETQGQIVTDGQQSSVCFGDSGGPAFVKKGSQWVQWGIASSVTSDACNATSVHTSVITYESWIKKTAKSMAGKKSPKKKEGKTKPKRKKKSDEGDEGSSEWDDPSLD